MTDADCRDIGDEVKTRVTCQDCGAAIPALESECPECGADRSQLSTVVVGP